MRLAVIGRSLTGRFPVVTVRSPLPPSVVAARLAELLTNEDQLRRRQNWLNRIGNYGNTRISGRYVSGQLVLRLRGGNNWRTDAKVEIVPQPDGSLVRLRSPGPLVVTIVLWFWLAMAVLFGVMALRDGFWHPLIIFPFGIGIVIVAQTRIAAGLDVIRDWVAWSVGSGAGPDIADPAP